MTVNELETNEKLKYWYAHIKQQRASGLSVTQYCKLHKLTPSTFYDYVKKMKQLICDEVNSSSSNAPVPFVSVPKASCTDKLTVSRSGIKIEIEPGTDYSTIESLIRSLL